MTPASKLTDTLKLTDLSDDLIARLAIYEDLLIRWQSSINLVSTKTIPYIWTRHFKDSLQLLGQKPQAKAWLDIGTGAGFPGMVIGMVLSRDPSNVVHLVEKDRKKCAFLREVSRETNANVVIHCARMEVLAPELLDREIEVVTARGLASLSKLVEYSDPFFQRGAVGLFLKGRNVQSEISDLQGKERFAVELIPSSTENESFIFKIRKLPTGQASEPDRAC